MRRKRKDTTYILLECCMITVTDAARKELEAYFADKERGAIRVYLAPGGCAGPRLALALDDAGEEDAAFEDGGFTFCINKSLLEKVVSVAIDLSDMGFMVEPSAPLEFGGSAGGCGTCCGGCGSH